MLHVHTPPLWTTNTSGAFTAHVVAPCTICHSFLPSFQIDTQILGHLYCSTSNASPSSTSHLRDRDTIFFPQLLAWVFTQKATLLFVEASILLFLCCAPTSLPEAVRLTRWLRAMLKPPPSWPLETTSLPSIWSGRTLQLTNGSWTLLPLAAPFNSLHCPLHGPFSWKQK